MKPSSLLAHYYQKESLSPDDPNFNAVNFQKNILAQNLSAVTSEYAKLSRELQELRGLDQNIVHEHYPKLVKGFDFLHQLPATVDGFQEDGLGQQFASLSHHFYEQTSQKSLKTEELSQLTLTNEVLLKIRRGKLAFQQIAQLWEENSPKKAIQTYLLAASACQQIPPLKSVADELKTHLCDSLRQKIQEAQGIQALALNECCELLGIAERVDLLKIRDSLMAEGRHMLLGLYEDFRGFLRDSNSTVISLADLKIWVDALKKYTSTFLNVDLPEMLGDLTLLYTSFLLKYFEGREVPKSLRVSHFWEIIGQNTADLCIYSVIKQEFWKFSVDFFLLSSSFNLKEFIRDLEDYPTTLLPEILAKVKSKVTLQWADLREWNLLLDQLGPQSDFMEFLRSKQAEAGNLLMTELIQVYMTRFSEFPQIFHARLSKAVVELTGEKVVVVDKKFGGNQNFLIFKGEEDDCLLVEKELIEMSTFQHSVVLDFIQIFCQKLSFPGISSMEVQKDLIYLKIFVFDPLLSDKFENDKLSLVMDEILRSHTQKNPSPLLSPREVSQQIDSWFLRPTF